MYSSYSKKKGNARLPIRTVWLVCVACLTSGHVAVTPTTFLPRAGPRDSHPSCERVRETYQKILNTKIQLLECGFEAYINLKLVVRMKYNNHNLVL